MRDFLPADVRKREYVIGIIKQVYESYGFEPLETPAVENIETLMGKYGEEGNQLIFKILKRGEKLDESLATGDKGRLTDLALRYDLTVPLARVVADNRNELPKFFKRYQIQPVWRADRPARGRFREFYQCDVDAIGSRSMVVEAEIISAVEEILTKLGFQDFVIRFNHRAVLTGLLESSQIPRESHEVSLVALDKIDKIGREGVQKELRERGISDSSGRKLLSFFEYFIKDHALSQFTQDERIRLANLGRTLTSEEEELDELIELTTRAVQGEALSERDLASSVRLLTDHQSRVDDVTSRLLGIETTHSGKPQSRDQAMVDLQNVDWNKFRNQGLLLRLISFTENNPTAIFGANRLAYLLNSSRSRHLRFDPSLARGLSYYTGTIIEINVPDLAGSLGGGGRYDGLIGMFGKEQIPACGFSLGLERILVVMDERGMFPPEIAESTPADVMVTLWSDETTGESLNLASELRSQGLRVTVYPEPDKFGKQMKYADTIRVPFVCVLGESEMAENNVTVKNMRTGEQKTVDLGGVADIIKSNLK